MSKVSNNEQYPKHAIESEDLQSVTVFTLCVRKNIFSSQVGLTCKLYNEKVNIRSVFI